MTAKRSTADTLRVVHKPIGLTQSAVSSTPTKHTDNNVGTAVNTSPHNLVNFVSESTALGSTAPGPTAPRQTATSQADGQANIHKKVNRVAAEPLVLLLTTLVFAISLALVQREHWPLKFNLSVAFILVFIAAIYEFSRAKVVAQAKKGFVDKTSLIVDKAAAFCVGMSVLVATVAAWHGQDVNSQILLSWLASIWSLSATFTLAAAPITWSLLAIPVWMAVTVLWIAEGSYTGYGAGIASFAAVAMQAWFIKQIGRAHV